LRGVFKGVIIAACAALFDLICRLRGVFKGVIIAACAALFDHFRRLRGVFKGVSFEQDNGITAQKAGHGV
jgi:hypothetical protein